MLFVRSLPLQFEVNQIPSLLHVAVQTSQKTTTTTQEHYHDGLTIAFNYPNVFHLLVPNMFQITCIVYYDIYLLFNGNGMCTTFFLSFFQ